MKQNVNFTIVFILFLVPITLLWSGCSNNNLSSQIIEQNLNIAENNEDLVKITNSSKLIESSAVKKFGSKVVEEGTMGNVSYAYIGMGEKDRVKYSVGLYKSIHLFVSEKDEGEVFAFSLRSDGNNYAFVAFDEDHKESLYYNNGEQTENLGEIYYSPMGGQGVWLAGDNLAYYKKTKLEEESLPHLVLNGKDFGFVDPFDMDEVGNVAYIKYKKDHNGKLYFNHKLKVKDIQNCGDDGCELIPLYFKDKKLMVDSGDVEEGGEYLVSDLLNNNILNQKK